MSGLQWIQFFTVLLSIIELTQASFGYCIGLTTWTNNFTARQVVAFELWNDRGDIAEEYRSVYSARQTNLANNGWHVWLKLHSGTSDWKSDYNLNGLRITSDMYGDLPESNEYELLCTHQEDYIVAYYYGCFENEYANFCAVNRDIQIDDCRSRLSMGSDGRNC
ncbi:hypothetical protein BGX20_003058 [Mortierella sp. AD010]|nr:hypothetical protein BGX20_003058 [Mortierella sp. AD010]